MDAVLASPAFDRSKNLSKLLAYICSRYFDGRASEIKEYNIAVDALERSADFDQKKDAIVRVEMHRLRKRLREYYAGLGARDPIQIVVADKGYVPEFVVSPAMAQFTQAGPSIAVLPQRREPALREVPVPVRKFRWWRSQRSTIWIGSAAVLALVVTAVLAFRSRWLATDGLARRGAASADSTAHSPTAIPVVADVRILAGRGPGGYTDRDGQFWGGDRYFRGGEEVSCRSDIVTRGFDRNVFASMREGTFDYAIPLPRGTYEAELFFAETQYGEGNPLGGGETSRRFDIKVNGATAIAGLDILADAGMPNSADTRILKDLQPAPDGFLHLEFLPAPGRKALVNAIWVRPSQPGRMNPMRITARPQGYRDPAGVWWLPDRYFLGGTQVLRPSMPAELDDPVVQGERYGDFSYAIPVAPGKYTANLYFFEYWWGPRHPGGVGGRQFDVYCNFKPILTGFDIVSEASSFQAVKKTFRGLTPNRHGKLLFTFVSRVNFAEVNAIEILDEAR